MLPSMTGSRILVVDDDPQLREVLDMALSDAGFEVRLAADGLAGWRQFEAEAPDLCILDVAMPEMDGFEVCRRIRASGSTPVVMLTSRDDDVDKIVGLELGADDYVTKPFSVRVLVARLRAVLRRTSGPEAAPTDHDVAQVRGLRVDRGAHRITLDDIEVPGVTATEFALLFALVAAPGRVQTRDQLVEAVYGPNIVVEARTVDTFVKRLRRKLRAIQASFDDIETVRAVGYRFRP